MFKTIFILFFTALSLRFYAFIILLACSSIYADQKKNEVTKKYNFLDTVQIERFIDTNKENILEKKLRRYFYEEYEYNAEVIELLKKGKQEKKDDKKQKQKKQKFPTYHTVNWSLYNRVFIQEKRIDLGVQHYHEHKEIYDRVAHEYGITPSLLIAILGVETMYGTIQGKYNVRNTLITNGFHKDSHRKSFYQKELLSFLQLSKQNPFIHQQKGSYAGAMGMGQFISSSYKHYAVDYDKDGLIDLFHSEEDAIASVANYFIKNKWQVAQPVAKLLYEFPFSQTESDAKTQKIKIHMDRVSDEAKKSLKKMNRIVLFKAKTYQLWGLYDNFKVIKRYNSLNSYAMAVHQLSQMVLKKI